ncbi:MAG: IS200/IS605 family accessory protein TnpB-related protein [Halobacteriales archaeon]|nr:IS200/IS605 family accessory protein TnpB-related protein [Halobacteriales archaeon]
MHTTLKRLQSATHPSGVPTRRFDHYQNALTDIVEKASRQAVEYATAVRESGVGDGEDSEYIRATRLREYMNRRLHSWAFARLQGRIEDKATEAGIPVRVRESGVHLAERATRATTSVGGLPGRVPVSERRLPRFDVSGGHQRFREHRTTG